MTRRMIPGLSRPPRERRATAAARFKLVGVKEEAATAVKNALRNVATEGEYVVVPVEEWERLVDAADDRASIEAYHRTRDEERVPADLVDRLMSGENPVRVWREHRGMKLEQLAAAIGKAKGFVSEIETGKKAGSIGTLRLIARTLQVELDDLVS